MSDMRTLLKALVQQGFSYRVTGSGHYLIRDHQGQRVATVPRTPSDWRSMKNAIAVLRRAGFTWKER